MLFAFAIRDAPQRVLARAITSREARSLPMGEMLIRVGRDRSRAILRPHRQWNEQTKRPKWLILHLASTTPLIELKEPKVKVTRDLSRALYRSLSFLHAFWCYQEQGFL